jgi:hypothetical protein
LFRSFAEAQRQLFFTAVLSAKSDEGCQVLAGGIKAEQAGIE